MQRIGLVLMVGLLMTTAAAAKVDVVPEAAWQGGFGLRVEVAEACPGEWAVLVLGPVVTVQRVEACEEVFVGSARVEDGGRLEALAGERVVFGSGFSVAEGGELAAGTSEGWDPGHLVEETPAGEASLFLRSYVRFDGVALEPGGKVSVLGMGDGIRERATVRYEADEEGGWLWVEVVEDDGTVVVSPRGRAGDGWHRLDLEWDAGAAITASGGVSLTVDGAEIASVDGLSLGALGLIESVKVGAWDATTEGGWIDFDEVAADRDGPPAD